MRTVEGQQVGEGAERAVPVLCQEQGVEIIGIVAADVESEQRGQGV